MDNHWYGFINVDGPNQALLIEFSLASSQYATMLLRELTKSETGSGYQMGLSRSTVPEKRKFTD